MTTDYASHIVPPAQHHQQTQARADQVENHAGGFVFEVDCWKRLDRFLILGAEGGSYYASEREMTLEASQAMKDCLLEDGPRMVARIVEISDSGRAPKNEPAIFALAVAAKLGDYTARHLAHEAMPKVCRTGTHLFRWAQYVKKLGGWGRGTKTAIARWYTGMAIERLALQVVKYQQRDGWSHRDVLRLAHVKPDGTDRDAVLKYAVKGLTKPLPHFGSIPEPLRIIAAHEAAKGANAGQLEILIEEFGLPHECVPNGAKNDALVWRALMKHMGTTALIRNLGKMTNVGLLKPMSPAAELVVERLRNVERLKKDRIHPFQVLLALKTYASGHGFLGALSWQPVQSIVDALNDAFYATFANVEPSGKRHLIAVDVSGSMGSTHIANSNLTAIEAAAALSLVTAATEPSHLIVAFAAANGGMGGLWSHHDAKLTEVPVSSRQRLDDVLRAFGEIPMGGTDCSLPMRWALQNRAAVDVFTVITDNETWSGKIHPFQTLKEYRQKMGIKAKLVVQALTATSFTIADPTDAGMLDVVGFDAAAPQIIADFAADRI